MRPPDTLSRGEFVRLAYRLGLSRATGVLEIGAPGCTPEVLVLRRGNLMTGDVDVTGRAVAARLARIAAYDGARYVFDGRARAYPPGALRRQWPLAVWARRHLEAQLDAMRAHDMVRELAGSRIALRRELVPDDSMCDDTDRRILAALTVPRRLDQVWPLARTPRFRLLTFIHFLRAVGGVELQGVAAPARVVEQPARHEARRLLGVDADADAETVKRAYRRLARALHPDLHPAANLDRRRSLERKFAEISAAYRELVGGC